MKKLFILLFVLFMSPSFLFSIENRDENTDLKSLYSKEEKLLYTNIATTTLLMIYGIHHWDHDILHTKPHAQSEGWFEKETKHGGADKFGHAYVGYLTSHLFSYSYENWGYTHSESALYGAYSSFLFTTVMEIGDSFSDFGLSYEDMLSNTIGAMLGYYSYKYERLRKLVDFKIEYNISKDPYKDDFTTDYENMKYIFSLKGSGFNELNNSYLKYFELYLGYYVKGYEKQPYIQDRNIFVGFGLNLSKIFNTKIFNYYQVPDIYINRSH